jgi:hypothetical protein
MVQLRQDFKKPSKHGSGTAVNLLSPKDADAELKLAAEHFGISEKDAQRLAIRLLAEARLADLNKEQMGRVSKSDLAVQSTFTIER